MLLNIMQYLVVLLITIVTWSLIWLHKRRTSFNMLPGPPSPSILLGNIPQLFDKHGWDFHKRLALDYGKIFKIHGPLSVPILYISDPVALQTVLGKDGGSWEQHEDLATLFRIVLGPAMASATTEVHRHQRKMLNPVFSPTNMCEMLPIFYDVVYKLRDAVECRVNEDHVEIDMHNWLGRTALELVGQGGLGYSFDPLVKDVADDYAESLKEALPTMSEIPIIRQLLPPLDRIGSPWLPRRVLELIPYKPVKRLVNIIETMSQRSAEIFESKKRALEQGDDVVSQQVGHGKDIMSVLMRANMAASQEDKLPDDQLIAQMSTMILAAMDTTTNSVSRVLQLITQYPEMQERLRAEILQAGAEGDPSYKELLELPCLNAACRETLRVEPPANMVFRTAVRDTLIPLSEPIRATDGSLISKLPVQKGTHIMLGILGCNVSPDLWGDDALEWNPERWLSPLPKALIQAAIPGVYSNLMTFAGGPRSCIGFKFAELELLVMLYVLLSNFRFELTDKNITWNVAQVRYPSVDWSDVPSMPLKVSLLKRPS